MNTRERVIRGTFSFIAAAAFVVVAAENAEYALQRHRPDRYFIAGAAAGFACWEALKVMIHIEELLGIDGHKHEGPRAS